MKVFGVKDENMDLADFVVGRFAYSRNNKILGTMVEAVQVTPENIGMLSLEFEAELFYSPTGEPHFSFFAERLTEGEGPATASRLYVRPSDWIMPLRNEFHVFRHYQFAHTFKPFGEITYHPMREDLFEGSPFVEEMKAYAIADIKQTAESFGQNIAWEEAEKEEALAQIADYKARQTGDLSADEWHNWNVRILPLFDFQPDDRVRIGETQDYGKVVVVDVEMGDGRQGVEVELEHTGGKHVFAAENLVKVEAWVSEGDGY